MGGNTMIMKEAVHMYIEYRHSLGEKYKSESSTIRCFCKHLGEEKELHLITTEDCVSFIYPPPGKVTQYLFARYSTIKGFILWAMARNYMPNNPLPLDLPTRPEATRPYIYTNDELKNLFAAALTYQKNRSTIHPECIQFILKLTYMLGLRIHETISLCLGDIDCSNNVLTIKESKFYKSRHVTFNSYVCDSLHEFIAWRKSVGMEMEQESRLFLDRKGFPMKQCSINGIFRRVCEEAGINRRHDTGQYPRIHDLRHTFAVNRLTLWYRNGEDVQELLPFLSTYLGHQRLANTSVYLTMTPDLLGNANDRFAKYANMEDLL